MYRCLLVYIVLFFCSGILCAQQLSVSGLVKNNHGPVTGATLVLNDHQAVSSTNSEGRFLFNNLSSGKYNIVITSVGNRTDTVQVVLKDADQSITIALHETNNQLDTVIVNAVQEKTAFTRLKDVEGTAIYA